jgi:hypothetical protein
MFEVVRREVTAVTALLQGPVRAGSPDLTSCTDSTAATDWAGSVGWLAGLVEPEDQGLEWVWDGERPVDPWAEDSNDSGSAVEVRPDLVLVPGARASGPHLVETAPAGSDLAVALEHYEPATLADTDLVGYLVGVDRMRAWLAGRELLAVEALLTRVEGWRGIGDDPRSSVPAAEMAATEVAAALSISATAARTKVEEAIALRRLPDTRTALLAGDLSSVKVRAITEAVAPLDDDEAHAVEDRVLARAAGQTPPALRAALRRAVIAAGPDAAQRRHEHKVQARAVRRVVLDDGIAELTWTAPAHEVEAFWLWLTGCALAAQGPRALDDRTLDQVRSDVLADLGARGLALAVTDTGAPLPTRKGRRPQIGVVVAATTLLGLDEEPGELTGVGPVTAPLARRIAADGEWRRLLTDPRTGRLDEVSADTYAPPQDMVDHVVTRDGTCRGLGCRIAATRCDLYHEVPWPAGPTAITNLQALHQHHHDVKTHTDTTVVTEPDGTTIWPLPSGRTYRVPPHQLLQHPDLDPEPLRAALRRLRHAQRQARERPDHPDPDRGHLGSRDGPPEHDTPPF